MGFIHVNLDMSNIYASKDGKIDDIEERQENCCKTVLTLVKWDGFECTS